MSIIQEAIQEEINSLERDLDVITNPTEYREVEYIINQFQGVLKKMKLQERINECFKNDKTHMDNLSQN